MNADWIYGFATSIKERADILGVHYQDMDTSPYLHAWRKRKTLVSDGQFLAMLKKQQLTEHDFGLGVKPLNEEDLKALFSHVATQNWYLLHQAFFQMDAPFDTEDPAAALRFHIAYMKQRLHLDTGTKKLHFFPAAVSGIEQALQADLLSIAQRTLVWDVHDTIKRERIFSSDKKAEWQQYLAARFSSREKTKGFYSEYPVLAKLLSDRVQYYIDNILFFFHALSDAKKQLKNVFSLEQPYAMQSFEISGGDSHNLGKRPILFTLNGQKLVFKYHSGENLLAYNQLLAWLGTLKCDFQLLQVTCVSGAGYCFEQYITHASCACESEVESYYRNYGYLAALLHFLGTTDIHMENLIAHGPSPVLIDTETLLGYEERRTYSSRQTKSSLMEADSVILSGLLPMQKYWKRQLDISALNGVTQKIPYKVRKLKNEKSSDILYSLEEAFITPAQNIPLLAGMEKPYQDYKRLIKNAYADMIAILREHAATFLQLCTHLFSSCHMRVLLRDTEDYQNFIQFSTHPSCMSDYIEREKIFENLWDHSFLEPAVVTGEIRALLNHDIPYFCAAADTLDLTAITGSVQSYFSKSILETLTAHICALDAKKITVSRLLLKESIHALECSYRKIEIPGNSLEDLEASVLTYATAIAGRILKAVDIHDRKGLVIWPYFLADKENRLSILFPDSNLYNGSAGLLIFFRILNEVCPKTTYRQLIHALENEVFFRPDISDSFQSAYGGFGSRATTAFILYRFTREKRYLHLLLEHLTGLYGNPDILFSQEWLRGNASLISLLASIYKELKIPLAYQLLETLVGRFEIPHTTLPGFAHGYAGMLYAFTMAEPLLPSHAPALPLLTDRLYHLTVEAMQPMELSDSWCNGTLGINKALLSYSELRGIPPVLAHAKTHVRESCLCHGDFGIFSQRMEQYRKGGLTHMQYVTEVSELLKKPLILKCEEDFVPVDLFTGLAGIGYELLSILFPDKILDILFL